MDPRVHPSVLVVALSLSTVVTCRLDPSAKSLCIINSDCLEGRVCLEGVCRAPPASASAGDAQPDEAGSGGAASCGSLLARNPCATTPAGRPMTCFRASALAGEDFCAEACDPGQAPTDPGHFLCVDSGALLQRCHPNGSADGSADCSPGLSCYRTSLLLDTGLCIQMPVCAKDSDCPSTTYNTCAATIVRGLSAASALLHLDHLNCMHPKCLSLKSDCTGSEGCLATQYAGAFADLCAPNCDSNSQCPPNYSCARVTSGLGSPNLCLPGVPGSRCDGDHCVLGACQDTGAGFSLCTIPCLSDRDCAPLNTSADAFVCVQSGAGGHCVTTRAFSGANCDTTDQCRADLNEFCTRMNVYGLQPTHGDCRVPCNADGTCDPRGGLPHGCLWGGAGGCFPGVLGVPCARQSECIAPLACQDVPPEPDVTASSLSVCTAPCAVDGGSDADADAQCTGPAIGGYCGNGWCRLRRGAGQPCSRGPQCQSGLCDGATHACLPIPSNPSGL